MEKFILENENKTQKIILAVLFAVPGAVSIDMLSKACDLDTIKTKRELEELKSFLKEGKSPILINDIDGKYELGTNPLYFEYLIKVLSTPQKSVLTDTMMETLAIVAAKKLTTRVEIEQIRGVKSDFAVNKLIEYGLIEEKGRMKLPGRPIILGPTDEFYRRFGVENLSGVGEKPGMTETEVEDGESSQI